MQQQRGRLWLEYLPAHAPELKPVEYLESHWKIASPGLRYSQFHSTSLCSPTRAALITGRNHHSVGFGVIGEVSTGYPGSDSSLGPDNATIGEILKENGYATSWHIPVRPLYRSRDHRVARMLA